jgi:hypothetical protein
VAFGFVATPNIRVKCSKGFEDNFFQESPEREVGDKAGNNSRYDTDACLYP